MMGKEIKIKTKTPQVISFARKFMTKPGGLGDLRGPLGRVAR